MYILLGNKRETIRNIAKKHYIFNVIDHQKAIEDAKEEIKTSGIVSSFLVSLAIKLAISLIMYWFENNILLPSSNYQNGEPGK